MSHAQLARLGIRQHDLLLFLDAFDCIVQRPLGDFATAWLQLVRRRLQLWSPPSTLARREAAGVVLLAEHSCWPWPLPGMQRVGRPRGVSMGAPQQ